jgi:hypothetical protein
LKSDDVQVKETFLDYVNYMREKFFEVNLSSKQNSKDNFDNEIKLEIMAENDISDWENIKVIYFM